MKYEEIVEKVKNATSKANVSRAVGHIAFQFNVEGEGEGAFYLEIADGKVYVEPYEYYDRDVIIVTTANVIMQMIEGGLQPMVAYTNEQMKVYGNIDHLKVLPLGCDSKQAAKQDVESVTNTSVATESEKAHEPEKTTDDPAKTVETEKKVEEPAKLVEAEKKNAETVTTEEAEKKTEETVKTADTGKTTDEPVKAPEVEKKAAPEKKAGSDKKLRKKHLRK